MFTLMSYSKLYILYIIIDILILRLAFIIVDDIIRKHTIFLTTARRRIFSNYEIVSQYNVE